MQDKIDIKRSPNKIEINKINDWIKTEKLEKKVKLLIGQKSRKTYEQGEKLTLFPNGTLSNTWCN